MDEKMRAAFDAWYDSDAGQRAFGTDIVEWALNYLRTQQKPVAYACKGESRIALRMFFGTTRRDAEEAMEEAGFFSYESRPLYAAPVPPSMQADTRADASINEALNMGDGSYRP